MSADKNKGLTDNGDGEFVLNESGTSVTIDADPDVTFSEDKNGDETNLKENKNDDKEQKN